MLAFSANNDGNTNVYVVPAGGGEPKRLTFAPSGDIVTGWTNDGSRVVFRSGRSQRHRCRATLHDFGERRPRDDAAASGRARRFVLLGRRAVRVRAELAVGAVLARLSRRPSHADLDRKSVRLLGGPHRDRQR